MKGGGLGGFQFFGLDMELALYSGREGVASSAFPPPPPPVGKRAVLLPAGQGVLPSTAAFPTGISSHHLINSSEGAGWLCGCCLIPDWWPRGSPGPHAHSLSLFTARQIFAFLPNPIMPGCERLLPSLGQLAGSASGTFM